VIKSEQIYNKSVSDKVGLLCKNLEQARNANEMTAVISDFYKDYGVGMIGLNKAFRLDYNNIDKKQDTTVGNADILKPVTSFTGIMLSDLIGYEREKELLLENTKAFVKGKKANNVLLYGDAGTGKSTSVKAILNEFYPMGLRMIEIYKHEFKYLNDVISAIKNRNYRFIIFMDDLSFEEFETEYKYLKAVIEGGLEIRPENVLIYATSNRRHLIRETWGDRADMDDELHRSDTVQEKISLSDRFGLKIAYLKPSQKDYFEIVKGIAAKHPELKVDEEALLAEARKWGISHGGMSGRTAEQMIFSLLK
nr:ATP-binding protein [Lachnospiraceae bacterium]